MRKKHIAFALILILIGVYLIVNRLGLFPKLPLVAIIFSVLFLCSAIHGLIRLQFTQATLSLAIIGCINDKLLHIEAITPWTLLLAALLIGIALDMIFSSLRKKKKKHVHNGEYPIGSYSENGTDGDLVRVDNAFSSFSKYVNSNSFREAVISNSFGECNVYFNNAILASGTATIHAENSFGSTNIYLPSTWRITTHQETAFGKISISGKGSNLPDAPCIQLNLESSFGEINIIFE